MLLRRDLFASETASCRTTSPTTVLVETGIIVQPPAGYYAQILPRSGFSSRENAPIVVPGVVDPGYRGTIKVAMKYLPRSSAFTTFCNCGERVAQLVFLPYWAGSDWEEKYDLADDATDRGTNGFGSTGV